MTACRGWLADWPAGGPKLVLAAALGREGENRCEFIKRRKNGEVCDTEEKTETEDGEKEEQH